MVASIEEQRSGLNDTLSLLDSMLANAPIGLAFFDRRSRCVRVNHVFAELTEVPLSRHLGKTLPELLPEPIGQAARRCGGRVFANEAAEQEIEMEGMGGTPRQPWTWLVSTYPIRTTLQPGALGRHYRSGHQRAQTQRGDAAQDGKAGRDRPAGGLHRPRGQQSSRSHHQPSLSAAELLRSGRSRP